MTMTYPIESRTLAPQVTAVVHADLYPEQLPRWLPEAYAEILNRITEAGLTPAGPPFARYRFHRDRIDVEAGFPVPTEITRHGRVVPSTLPGGRAAVTTHYGPYESVAAAYHAVSRWLAEHGHLADGPHWEVYHNGPQSEPDPARWRTDLVAPYR